MVTPRDHAEAARIAAEAGRLLVRIRDEHPDPETRRRALRDAGDLGSHRLIVAELGRAFPDDAVLSEEAADDVRRLHARRVWIVDPLDGTREFGEVSRTDWAVHVALWEDGDLVAGAVALPALDAVLATDRPPALAARTDGPVRIVVSRTRPPDVAVRLAAALDGVLVPLGSAGAKAMAVLRGDADVYAHAGGQHEWDSAAPVAVARAAGAHTSRIDGSPLVYNQPDTWLPDLLICRPELASPVLEVLRS